jgi:arogenate dehydrogenase (NADP+)
MKEDLKKINIGVIGLGLIGGSLALRLAKEGINILAFSRSLNPNTENTPFKWVGNDLSRLNECQIVFICSPISSICTTLEKIAQYLKPGTIISDVASVKSEIVEFATKNFRKDCFFIGGHPMAGTEKQGFANAFPELFEGRPWVLIKDTENSQANAHLEGVLKLTGAKVLWSDSQSHDRAVAYISHLPLLLSLKLLQTIQNISDPEIKTLAENLASSGFEGMVRLAKGNKELNEDILKNNDSNIKAVYKEFESIDVI